MNILTHLPTNLQGGAPLFTCLVPAGFPSPAEGHSEGRLDLNDYLVRNRAATFFVRVQGDSMTGAGIHDGDLLVVDRSISPREGNIVLAVLDGAFTVKRLGSRNGKPLLLPENPTFRPVEVGEGSSFEVWGVATFAVHKL